MINKTPPKPHGTWALCLRVDLSMKLMPPRVFGSGEYRLAWTNLEYLANNTSKRMNTRKQLMNNPYNVPIDTYFNTQGQHSKISVQSEIKARTAHMNHWSLSLAGHSEESIDLWPDMWPRELALSWCCGPGGMFYYTAEGMLKLMKFRMIGPGYEMERILFKWKEKILYWYWRGLK